MRQTEVENNALEVDQKSRRVNDRENEMLEREGQIDDDFINLQRTSRSLRRVLGLSDLTSITEADTAELSHYSLTLTDAIIRKFEALKEKLEHQQQLLDGLNSTAAQHNTETAELRTTVTNLRADESSLSQRLTTKTNECLSLTRQLED